MHQAPHGTLFTPNYTMGVFTSTNTEGSAVGLVLWAFWWVWTRSWNLCFYHFSMQDYAKILALIIHSLVETGEVVWIFLNQHADSLKCEPGCLCKHLIAETRSYTFFTSFAAQKLHQVEVCAIENFGSFVLLLHHFFSAPSNPLYEPGSWNVLKMSLSLQSIVTFKLFFPKRLS